MADWNPSANEIFLNAMEIGSPEQRRVYLDAACAQDQGLRQAVEALLQAHAQAGSFLDKPGDATIAPPDEGPAIAASALEKPGTRIGPYKLLQQLGEGGMGVVFLAEQQVPVRRMVALKIIKQGMDSGQIVARFESERQALALMDHPNIARVLDAGTTDAGRPYFVMELIKGIPITKFCDQEHLTPRQRLELFIPVCQAVQHAHQKGIIHRDLKPSNVMIALYDGKPVPKVIDFGIAKATTQKLTDRTLFTEVGSMVGTLEYMAPEQAELNNLDIDTRADIYALGVLLYELLTGSPPFSAKELRSKAFTEMLRIIREVEPPKPSTKLSSSQELPAIAASRKLEPNKLTRQVQGDLDWIVMKCLEKERGRRYETANAVVQDIQRYLEDEPVLAGPPSAGYRLRKFVKRNRGAVTAASMVLLTVVLGIMGTTWGWLDAVQARKDEADARDGAIKEQRKTAEALKETEKAQVKAEDEKRTAENARRDAEAATTEMKIQLGRAETLLYASRIAFARKALDAWDVAKANEWLAACKPELRGWEHRLLTNEARRRMAPLALGGKENMFFTVALRPDGKEVACLSEGGIHVLRLPEQKMVQTLVTGQGGVGGLEYAPDGRWLAVAVPGEVQLWDTAVGKRQHVLAGHAKTRLKPDEPMPQKEPQWPPTFAFSGDGKRLVSSDQEDLRVWEVATGRLVTRFPLQDILGLGVNPNGSMAAVIRGGRLAIVDLATGKVLREAEAEGRFGRFQNVAWSPKGDLIALAGDNNVSLYGVDAKLNRKLPWLVKSVSGVRFSPDGGLLACVSAAFEPAELLGSVQVWDMASNAQVAAFPTDDSNDVVSFSIANSGLFAACFQQCKASLWNFRAGQESLRFAESLDIPLPGSVLSSEASCLIAAFSPPNADGEQSVCSYDIQTGNLRHKMPLKNHTRITPSPNGQWVAAVDQKGQIQLFDFQKSKHMGTLAGTGEVTVLGFTPDGKSLVTADERAIQLHDLKSRKVTTLYEGLNPKAVGHNGYFAFNPDSKQFVLISEPGSVMHGDMRGGPLRKVPGPIARVTAAFSPDGRLLALFGAREGDDNVHFELVILEADTLREVKRFDDIKKQTVANLTFTGAGDRLLVSFANATVRVLDVRTWQDIYTVTPPRMQVGGAFFSRNGDTMALMTFGEGGRWNVEVYNASDRR